MPYLYRLHYAPYADYNWSVTPGACTDMTGFMMDQFGSLKGMRLDGGLGFSLTGSDIQYGECFPQTNGGSRFIIFRDTDLDEYDSAGTRTNRATGLSSGTWRAAAWGNQIIACNFAAATQSSTGGAFSSLAGAPKARHIAANVNFVMTGDVDDGSFTNPDAVWWCGIRNPTTWTPNQATQAGRIRLLDVPGPVTGVAAYRDEFIVFKSNAVLRGRYIGPPYVFEWKVIAVGVGYTGRHYGECDGKLYFSDINGVYAYDGSGVTEISKGMWAPSDGSPGGEMLQCTRDGVLWVTWAYSNLSAQDLRVYCFNARVGLWSRLGPTASAVDPGYPTIVRGTGAALYNFKSTWGTTPGFVWITNDTSNKCTLAYPGTTDTTPTLQTGLIGGEHENAPASSRVYLRLLPTSSSSAVTSGTMRAYRTELETSTDSASLTWNETQQTLDGTRQANYKDVSVTFTTNKIIVCGGLGLEQKQGARR